MKNETHPSPLSSVMQFFPINANAHICGSLSSGLAWFFQVSNRNLMWRMRGGQCHLLPTFHTPLPLYWQWQYSSDCKGGGSRRYHHASLATQQLWMHPSCKAAPGEGAICLMREHVARGARSTIAPPWFCEGLREGDFCRVHCHLLFYPSTGM